MSKNENDPFENTNEELTKQPEEKVVPAPLLTPETVKKMTPQAEPRKQEEPENQEAAAKGKAGTKKVLLITVSTLLVAGAVTAAVLAGTGAFGKGKNSNTEKETTETTTEATTEKKETTAATTTTAASSDTSATTETTSVVDITYADMWSESKLYITSLDELTDDQRKTMQEQTLEEFKRDLRDQKVSGQVTVDVMNYAGSLLMESYDPEAIDDPFQNVVFPIYQMQITDTTTGTPVKRQLFYAGAFSARKDGGVTQKIKGHYINTLIMFEKWEILGGQDVDVLVSDIREWMNQKLDDDIDEKLLVPFDGKEPSEFLKDEALHSLDQITPELERAIKDNTSTWLGPEFIKNAPSGVVIDSYEIIGKSLAVSSTGKYSKLFIFVECHYTDLRGGKPEEKSFFWYNCFPHIYQNNELRMGTQSFEEFEFDIMSPGDWIKKYSSLDEVRKTCKLAEQGWDYTEDFSGYAKSDENTSASESGK